MSRASSSSSGLSAGKLINQVDHHLSPAMVLVQAHPLVRRVEAVIRESEAGDQEVGTQRLLEVHSDRNRSALPDQHRRTAVGGGEGAPGWLDAGVGGVDPDRQGGVRLAKLGPGSGGGA